MKPRTPKLNGNEAGTTEYLRAGNLFAVIQGTTFILNEKIVQKTWEKQEE